MNTGQVVPDRQTARRLLEANRDVFDSSIPAPGAVERRVTALEDALAAARAEADILAAHVQAFETSTIWRLTRPIRVAMNAVRPARMAEAADDLAGPAPAAAALSYDEWIATEEPACLAALEQPGPGYGRVGQPSLGLVLRMAPGHTVALAALLDQCPAGCTVLVVGEAPAAAFPQDPRILWHPAPLEEPAAAVGLALARLDTDMLCFLDARDRLAPCALLLATQALAQQPQLDLVFADEDWLDASGRRVRPFFKPGWDCELQRGRDLAGPFAFYRTALVRAAVPPSGGAWRHDLASQVAAATRPERIHHIPAILCHRGAPTPVDAAAAGTAQLRRAGVPATVEPVSGQPGWGRVRYELPQPEPLVSVIVPTRDHAALLQVCADGVLNQTEYRRLELLVVDNGTTEPDAAGLIRRLAADRRVRVIRQDGAFNWSALNNAAAAQAQGEILVLLNNDIAVLQPDWLTVLVSHAIQPGVGAVGAKLLYPDGTVQHAGLTTDAMGVPRHLMRYAAADDLGPCGLLGLAREVWGVTGACLAISRDVFWAVGGLNEALPVAYNDVDLCLRLTAHGYRIIWTPWSVLQHRELASRPPDHTESRRVQARAELDRLLRDWGALVRHDPYLNPNLQLANEQLWLRRTAPPSPR